MMASPLPAASSRSSPVLSEQVLRSRNAPKSIDDLTVALQNFAGTRSSSPEISSLECCCQKDICAHLDTWKNVKAKLESRLVLSAEVGQALLQRYEAYAKRQDAAFSRQASATSIETPNSESPRQHIESLTTRLNALTEENSIMESRIQELLIKTELSDATTRALQQELHDARTNVNKLTAQQSRTAGLELRLSQVAQERDDFRQERDSALRRARSAEMRAQTNTDNAGNLQREANVLREELTALRASRNDFSQAVLQEAKSRLEILRRSLNVSDPFIHAQTARVIESLVADNEALKKDVSELNMLLDETRDELQEAREKWDEETRVHNFDDTLDFGMRYPRDKSVQTDGLLFANNNQLSHPTTTAFALPSPRPSILAVESIGSSHSDDSSIHRFDKEKPPNGGESTSAYQSQGSAGSGSNANTAFLPGQAPSQLAAANVSFSAHDSEPITLLTNTLSSILTRLTQTDARTLTLRLRKQHILSGAADPRIVSQATIKSIVNDIAALRLGRDSGLKWKVTRAEVKAILRLFKQIFELACAMRATLNEVTFDPSVAHRLKKEALATSDNSNNSDGAGSGWIQKLFGQGGATAAAAVSGSSSGLGDRAGGSGSSSMPDAELRHPVPQRPSAKLAPAIAASAMTVSVVGPDARHGLVSADDVLRAASPPMLRAAMMGNGVPSSTNGAGAVPLYAPTPRSLSLMGIFAGAPFPSSSATATDEKWVVLPRPTTGKFDSDGNSNRDKDITNVAPGNKERTDDKREPDRFRQLRGAFSNISLNRSAMGLVNGKGRVGYKSLTQDQKPEPYLPVGVRQSALSGDVHLLQHHPHPFAAGIAEYQEPEPLLQRTLRPRGLSDSSIRTTFLKGDAKPSQRPADDEEETEEEADIPGPLSHNSSHRRQLHQPTTMSTTSTLYGSPPEITPASSFTSSPPRAIPMQRPLSARPVRSFVPSSWVESGIIGSVREDGPIHSATWARKAIEGRDY